MSKTAFTGRQLGEAADVLEAMARDKDAFVVMTLAGAMTVAKQGLIIAELIDRGIVNAIVSTGALMAHGLVEATGRAHFRHNPELQRRGALRGRIQPRLRHARTRAESRRRGARDARRLQRLGRGRSDVLLQVEPRDRSASVEACQRAARHSEVGLRKECSGICPGIFRLRTRPRLRLDQPRARQEGKPRFRFDPFEDLESLRRDVARVRNGWEFSPSAEAFRATGRSSSGRSSNCAIAGAGKTCR